jgi:hypothetical protein
MSDYVTELRRELVDAAERERRRSAPRRAFRRGRRPLATALAGAAALAAALLGIALLAREQPAPPPAALRVVDTIRLGRIPQGAVLGAGSVWVAEHDGRMLRVDPSTRRVIATAAAGTSAYDRVAATSDAIWLIGAVDEQEQRYRLVRIDPSSNRVVARIGSFGGPARRSRPRPTRSGCRGTSRCRGRSAASIRPPIGSAEASASARSRRSRCTAIACGR